MPRAADAEPAPPRLSLLRLFFVFARFGALAWGGPIAQIAMVRHELVDRQRWVEPQRFLRTLAVYQALPGPEAHEMCCWFGCLARGRLGGLVAGLGFMLPGTLLMLLCASLYGYLDASPLRAAAFAGMQAAVVAIVVRAVPRLSAHALTDGPTWTCALIGAGAEAAGLPFWWSLAFATVWVQATTMRTRVPVGLAFALLAWVCWPVPVAPTTATAAAAATPGGLLLLGLQAGMLTFGGAYTAIPLVRNEAVVAHGWLGDGQFLDGLALGGVLPAPLIVFGTFTGYVAGGLAGALAMTAGMFAPAFAFTLVGHDWIERLVAHRPAHRALDAMAAVVTGLIAVTAARLGAATLDSAWRVLVFALALGAAWRWRSPWLLPAIVLGAAAAGVICG